MKTKQKITMLLSLILTILLISTGLSFAYFSANITGTETSTTIQASGGVMNINYDGGENINTPNIFPSNEPFATKNFTLTGKNTTNDNMNYHIILVIEENTFTNNALQYKLTSTNTDGNGTTAPSIIQSGIANGSQEIFLGDGTFESPVNNKDHSYILELFFPETGKSQNDDMNKTFKAYINIREGQYNFPGYNPEKGVNHPVLFTGMTPIKWDENNDEIETTESDSDWYDYDEKRWANAKSLDGSYWVWIPRYAYKIETCYHTSGEDCLSLTGKEAGDIDVKFLKGTTNITEDNTIIESAGYVAHEKDTSMHHFLHPVFQFDGEELGFWVAKFEPSVSYLNDPCRLEPSIENCNHDNLTIKLIPNVVSLRYIDVYNSSATSMNMKNKTETYGWLLNELDSHMMTNEEWGAMAYLTGSQYGADGEVWINNSSYYITGCAGSSVSASRFEGCQHQYNTSLGIKASTTHNIYGIYDISGGSRELVMGNFNNYIGVSGYTSFNLKSLSDQYINRYFTNKKDMLNGISMHYNSQKYGDAVYEVSSNAGRYNGSEFEGEITNSWYLDRSALLFTNGPWFLRGGLFHHTDMAGVFCFTDASGGAGLTGTFRPVLMPIKK